MITLCIASPERRVGKTALCIGIARKLQSDGKNVGYFKPLSVRPKGEPVATDCIFANEILELERDQEALCPVVIGQEEMTKGLQDRGFPGKIQNAYREASREKEVMLIEGPAGLGKGEAGVILLGAILEAIPAKLAVVMQYAESGLKQGFDAIEPELRNKITGLIVNGVPANRMAQKAQNVAGIDVPVWGFLPQDRTLMGISVREIAEVLSGEEIVGIDGSSELVENVMAGAAVLDSGPYYFGRKFNKAVLLRGERPDMQLAALETPTKVMVLTGGVKPIDQVLKQARRRKVPVLVTREDTATALSRISEAVQNARFAHRQKAIRFDEIMGQHFDFKGLCKAIGL